VQSFPSSCRPLVGLLLILACPPGFADQPAMPLSGGPGVGGGVSDAACDTVSAPMSPVDRPVAPVAPAQRSIEACPSTNTTCRNGGSCFIVEGRQVFCVCTYGYTGTYCERPIGEPLFPDGLAPVRPPSNLLDRILRFFGAGT